MEKYFIFSFNRFGTSIRQTLCPAYQNCTGDVQNVFVGSEFANFGTLCPKDEDCSGAVDTIFVNFDRVLTATTDATPACMAMYGPNIDVEEIENSSDGGYDQCGLLFDLLSDETGAETLDYAKWVDLKCNQRTRALICTMLGKLSCTQ